MRVQPNLRPAGTPLLLVPLVLAGGWRAAFLLPLLCVIGSTLVLARWLHEEGRSPLFALLLLGYLPVLVLGRVAMSDLPSALVGTLGLWMFWRGLSRGRFWSLGAGVFAGASLLFRDTNPLLFLALFAGTVLRRERTAWWLGAGGILGVSLRLASGAVLHGDPFFVSDPLNTFDLISVVRNTPIYLLALLGMVPGGLAGALLYRGRRRPEILITLVAWVLLYLSYQHAGQGSGSLKQLVQGPRYFIPLVPLLAFAMAESIPRLGSRWGWGAVPLRARAARAGVRVWIAGVALAAFAVHPALDRFNRTQASLVRALYAHTTPDAVVVTNMVATGKFLNELYGFRHVINRPHLEPSEVPRLLAESGSVQLAFLNRLDSEYYRGDAAENDAFVRGTETRCRLVLLHDAAHSASDHLRIWQVRECPPAAR
jgi:hypothetical protein